MAPVAIRNENEGGVAGYVLMMPIVNTIRFIILLTTMMNIVYPSNLINAQSQCPFHIPVPFDRWADMLHLLTTVPLRHSSLQLHPPFSKPRSSAVSRLSFHFDHAEMNLSQHRSQHLPPMVVRWAKSMSSPGFCAVQQCTPGPHEVG